MKLNELVRDVAPKKTAPSLLADALRAKIMAGELAPGTRLVEAELVKVYRTSRSTVREALHILSSEDFLVVEKYKSPVVRGASKQKVFDILSVRAILEGSAAGLAAEQAKGSRKFINWLEKELKAWKAVTGKENPKPFLAWNDAFHARIIEMSGNDLLVEQIHTTDIPGYKKLFLPEPTPSDIIQSAKQHIMIVQHILKGDKWKAEKAMRAHVERTRERVVACYDQKTENLRSADLLSLRETAAL